MAYWSKGAKYRSRNRRKRNYIALYQSISDKYKLNLKYTSIEREAHERAQKEVDAVGFAWDVFTDPAVIITFIFAIIITVITIFVPAIAPATWKSWEGFGASLTIAATWGSVGLSAYDAVEGRPERDYFEAKKNLLSNNTAFKRNAQEALQQRDLLTYFLVFAPYEICATGAIYQAQAPSAARNSTFSPSQAFDTSKGFLGTYKKDKVDEMIGNRAHTTLAGNINYNGTGISDFPLAKFNDRLDDRLNSYEDALKGAVERLAKGFQELADNQYGYWGGGEGAKQDYKDCYNEQCEPYKKLMINDSFLDMMKSYQSGIRYDWLQLITHRTFAEKTRTKEEVRAVVKQAREALVKKFADKEGDIDEKAKLYYEAVSAMCENFYSTYLDSSVAKEQIYYWGVFEVGAKKQAKFNWHGQLLNNFAFTAGAWAEVVNKNNVVYTRDSETGKAIKQFYKKQWRNDFSSHLSAWANNSIPKPSIAIPAYKSFIADLAKKYLIMKAGTYIQPYFIWDNSGEGNHTIGGDTINLWLLDLQDDNIYDLMQFNSTMSYTDEITGEKITFQGDFSILDDYDWTKIDGEYDAFG